MFSYRAFPAAPSNDTHSGCTAYTDTAPRMILIPRIPDCATLPIPTPPNFFITRALRLRATYTDTTSSGYLHTAHSRLRHSTDTYSSEFFITRALRRRATYTDTTSSGYLHTAHSRLRHSTIPTPPNFFITRALRLRATYT